MEISDGKFWKNKNVFITGHSGFKGSWLSLWLLSLGANVKGYSLKPDKLSLYNELNIKNELNSVFNDIRNFDNFKREIQEFNPDILFHLAAQPIVSQSYKDPIETYSTNVIGTVNVLEAARSCMNLRSIISVTSDKCYENKEWHYSYREIDPLGGKDPYSSSKACADIVTNSYRNSFFSDNSIQLATARAGNVIGGGDWSIDRLLPDIFRAFENENELILRNPFSIRPWQHVLEPIYGYMLLAKKMYNESEKYNSNWNFGPEENDCKSVEWIVKNTNELLPYKVKVKIETNSNLKESNLLKLDSSKSKILLNWNPKWDLKTSLSEIVNWHLNWLDRGNAKELCLNTINKYIK